MGIRSYIDSLKEFGEVHRPKRRLFPDDSVVYRIYNWWKSETGYEPPGGKENFCHFFWTIVLRAPLLWIRQEKSRRVKAVTITCLAVFCIIEALAIWSGGKWWIPLVLIAGVWAFLCFMFTVAIYSETDSFKEFKTEFEDSDPSYVSRLLDFMSMPIVLPTYVLCFVVDKTAHAAPVQWMRRHIKYLLCVIGGVALAIAINGLFFSGLSVPWMEIFQGVGIALLVSIGVLVAFVAFGLGHTALSDRMQERRSATQITSGPPKRSRVMQVLRVPWDLLKLVFTFVVVVKRLLMCPYVDIPEPMAAAESS